MEPLSTPPLSSLVHWFISPLSILLDDLYLAALASLQQMAIKILVTWHVYLRNGTLKDVSTPILETHHIDAHLPTPQPITIPLAVSFSCYVLLELSRS